MSLHSTTNLTSRSKRVTSEKQMKTDLDSPTEIIGFSNFEEEYPISNMTRSAKLRYDCLDSDLGRDLIKGILGPPFLRGYQNHFLKNLIQKKSFSQNDVTFTFWKETEEDGSLVYFAIYKLHIIIIRLVCCGTLRDDVFGSKSDHTPTLTVIENPSSASSSSDEDDDGCDPNHPVRIATREAESQNKERWEIHRARADAAMEEAKKRISETDQFAELPRELRLQALAGQIMIESDRPMKRQKR